MDSIPNTKRYCKPMYTRYIEITGADGTFVRHLCMGVYPRQAVR